MAWQAHSLVLVSIIVGLAITDLIGDFHRLIRARAKVRWDPLALAWAVIALMLIVNFWSGVYLGLTAIAQATNGGTLLLALAPPVLLYMLCACALPERVPPEGLDLRESYWRERRYFFGLLTAYLCLTVAQAIVAYDAPLLNPLDLLRYLLIALVVPLLWSRHVAYHWFVAAFTFLLLLVRLATQDFTRPPAGT